MRRGVNILMLAPQFYRWRSKDKTALSDIENSMVEISKRGHNIYVLASRINDLPGYETLAGIKIFRVRPLAFLPGVSYHVSFPFLKSKEIVGKYNIQVLHANHFLDTHTLVAAVLSKVLNRPFVLAIEGEYKTTGRWYVDVVMRLWEKSFGMFAVKVASRIIVLDKVLAEYVVRLGALPNKVVIIPSGVDMDYFDSERFDASEIRKQLNMNNSFVVGYVGRFVPLKGVKDLIKAVSLVREKFGDVRLLLVGDGPLRLELEKLASRLGVPAIFTGWTSDPRPFYAVMDILVNPSYSEGLPIVALEAMAMGKPIVLTEVGGCRSLVKDGQNGFLIPPGNYKMLSEKIIFLIKNEQLRRKMGRLNRVISTERYSLKGMVDRWLTEFYKCLPTKASNFN
jgi:glycosyltransferase involved in cell wall biosynthesis